MLFVRPYKLHVLAKTTHDESAEGDPLYSEALLYKCMYNHFIYVIWTSDDGATMGC